MLPNTMKQFMFGGAAPTASNDTVTGLVSAYGIKSLMLGSAAAAILMASSLAFAATAQTTNINLSVASNFYGSGNPNVNTSAIADLIYQFEQANPTYTVTVVDNGATATLESHITAGNTRAADLFLAADVSTPQDLVTNYSTMVSGSPFNYAEGFVALLSNTTTYDVSCATGTCGYSTLAGYTSVAIANPSLAPYGEASRELLWSNFGIDYTTVATIHTYANITAAYNAVIAGTDPVGFVALSAICYGGVYPTPAPAGRTAEAYNPTEAEGGTISYNYKPLQQAGIVILEGTSRTSAQNTELAAFITYLTNFTTKTSSSTSNSEMISILTNYCYSAPHQ